MMPGWRSISKLASLRWAEHPQDALRICQEVPGLGLTLDYSHFVDPGHSQGEVEPLHAYADIFTSAKQLRADG